MALPQIFVEIGAKIDNFQTGMQAVSKHLSILDREVNKATSGFDKMSNRMSGFGKAMTASITLPLAAAGVAVTKLASDFDGGMRRVTSLLGLTSKQADVEFKSLSAGVLRLAKDLKVDAVVATDALYQAISAGVPKDNALEFIRVASVAAIAGVTNTNVAVDALTSVIAAYNLEWKEAKNVSDAMFQAVNIGKFTFEQLAATVGPAAQQAANLGVSYKELLATVSTLSISSGGVGIAFTQIESAMRGLIKPNEEMKRAFKEIGFESGSAAVAALGFTGTLDKLRESTLGSKEAFQRLFGRIEGLTGALALTGEHVGQTAKNFDIMSHSIDSARKAMDEIDKSAPRQMQMVLNELKVVGIEAGDILLPLFKDLLKASRPLIDDLGDMVKAFTRLSPEVQSAALAFTAFGIALGPTVIGIAQIAVHVPQALLSLRALTKAFDVSATATGTLSIALRALPWVALAAGIGLALDQLNKTDTAKGNLKNAADKEKKDLETVNEQYRNQQVLLGNLYPKVDQLRESVFSFAAGLGKTGKTVKDVSGEISAFERAVREEVSALEDADKKTAVHEEAMRRTGRTSKKVAGEITDFNKKVSDILADVPKGITAIFDKMDDGSFSAKASIKQMEEAISDANLKWKQMPASVRESIDNIKKTLEEVKFAKDIVDLENLEKDFIQIDHMASVAAQNLQADFNTAKKQIDRIFESPVLVHIKPTFEQRVGDEIASFVRDITNLGVAFENAGMKQQSALRAEIGLMESGLERARAMQAKYGESVVSHNEILALQLRIVQAKIEEGSQTGKNISKLLEQEAALQNQLQAVINFTTKVKFALVDVFHNIGRDLFSGISSLVKDLFSNNFNKQLEEQAVVLRRSLQDKRDELNKFEGETQRRISEVSASYAEKIKQETQQLRDSLAKREQDYADFAAEITGKMQQVTRANREELEKQRDQIRKSLADKERAYSDYVRDAMRKEQEIRRANEESLRSQLKSLQDNLKERSRAYQDFMIDAGRKLDSLNQKFFSSIQSNDLQFQRSKADEQRSYSRDTIRLNEEIQKAEAEGDTETTARLRKELSERSTDHLIAMQRMQEDNAIRVAEIQQQNTNETSALSEEISKRVSEYDEFVKQMKERQAEIEKANSESLAKQLADLQKGLNDQLAAIDKARIDFTLQMQQVTLAADVELQKQLEDLRKSLSDKLIELENFRIDIEAKIVEMSNKYAAEMEREVNALNDALAAKIAAYDAFNLEVIDKLQALEDAHRSTLSRIGDMFKEVFSRALEGLSNLVGSILWESLEKRVKKALFGTGVDSGIDAAAGTAKDAAQSAKEAADSATRAAGVGGGTKTVGGSSGGISGLLTGYVAPISAAVSAISDVVSNFQFAHMNTALGRIEESDRRSEIHLSYILEKINAYLPNLGDLMRFNWDVFAPWMARIETLLERAYGEVAGDITTTADNTNELVRLNDSIATGVVSLSNLSRSINSGVGYVNTSVQQVAPELSDTIRSTSAAETQAVKDFWYSAISGAAGQFKRGDPVPFARTPEQQAIENFYATQKFLREGNLANTTTFKSGDPIPFIQSMDERMMDNFRYTMALIAKGEIYNPGSFLRGGSLTGAEFRPPTAPTGYSVSGSQFSDSMPFYGASAGVPQSIVIQNNTFRNRDDVDYMLNEITRVIGHPSQT